MTTYKYDRDSFLQDVTAFYKPVDVLLDIGCGIRPFTETPCQVHICVEPYKEYVDVIKGYCPSDSHYIFLNTDALSAMRNFADESVDTVCMNDLIEHLEKEDGEALLKEAERIARKQIIVFTPLGYFPQEYHAGEKDAWGLDGAEFQEHKSGWLPEDFGEGWDFHVCERFHIKEECHIEIDKDYGCFYAIRNKEFQGFESKENTPELVKIYASKDRRLKTKYDYAKEKEVMMAEVVPQKQTVRQKIKKIMSRVFKK